MSFTILSAALLLTVGTGIILEVLRGYRRGLIWTAISLSAVVFSALVAAPLAVWLSDIPAKLAGNYLPRLIPGLNRVTDQFPGFESIIPALIDALISSILFVLFFLILRLITRVVVAVLFRKKLAPRPEDPGDPIYESYDAPWHRRHSRLLGGIVGGGCGLLVSLILLSPTLGLLSMADTLISTVDDVNIQWSKMGLKEEQVEFIQGTVNDPVANVLEAVGGGILFDAGACTRLNGRLVSLRNEAEACSELVTVMMSSMGAMKDFTNITPEQKEVLAELGGMIERSEVTRILASDVLNIAAEAWLSGRTFMNIPLPTFNEHISSLMEGALEVCAESTPDCVGRDISTLMNIYLIASESGLFSNPSYDQLASSLEGNGVIERIYNEVMDNPCTVSLAGRMTDMAIHMMATAIDTSRFDDLQMDSLMTHLSDSINRVNGMATSNADRVKQMKDYTMYYAQMYGMNVPESLAEVAATALIDKMSDKGGRITADDLRDLFNQYVKGK